MRVFLIPLLLLLAACGFRPMYGAPSDNQSVTAPMKQVQILPIPDAMGQMMRNALLDRLPVAEGPPRYALKVQMGEAGFGISIARDATVTRQQLRTNVHAELLDTQTQKILWREDMSATSGYNVLGSQYSNLVGSEDARKRNIESLADRLTATIAQKFSKQADDLSVRP